MDKALSKARTPVAEYDGRQWRILGAVRTSCIASREIHSRGEADTSSAEGSPFSFTYHTLQLIHCRPTVISHSLFYFRRNCRKKCGAHFRIPAIVLSMTLSFGYDPTVFSAPKQPKRKYINSRSKHRHTFVTRYL